MVPHVAARKTHQRLLKFSFVTPKRLLQQYRHLADVATASSDVRFSNRPFGVKRFQTIHHHSVDVARGLVLLFGIGTKALVWGFFCQGVRQSGKSFVLCQFLCSLSKPVSSSRPACL